MSEQLHVFSQVVPVDGGVNQDAVSKLLAREASNPWPVFFKEVFQNSNDARLKLDGQFSFLVETKPLGQAAVDFLHSAQLDDGVEISYLSPYLSQISPNSTSLFVTDKGTTGLGGGLDPRNAGESSKFCNFFYKYGREQGSSHDGGAFGFGRNVFFSASTASTIFVYTKFQEFGVEKSRLMGMTANKHFAAAGKNYTGRHWWANSKSESGTYMPFEGSMADSIAEKFGFPKFESGETGTSVMVVSPATESPSSLARDLQICALIYAWPHFLSEPGRKPTRFEFTSFGQDLAGFEEDLSDTPLGIHAATFLGLVNENDSSPITVSSVHQRLKDSHPLLTRAVGSLNYEKFAYVPSEDAINQELQTMGFPSSSSIALMRSPRIVVKYLDVGDKFSPTRTMGSFVVSPEWDPVFREAENLTHDEWEPGRLGLPKGAANPVIQVLKNIPALFSPQQERSKSEISGNALLADEIASLLSSASIGGSGPMIPDDRGGAGHVPGGGSPPGGKPRSIKFSEVSRGLVKAEGNRVQGYFDFAVKGTLAKDEHFSARVFVVNAAGKEDPEDAPLGTVSPIIKDLQFMDRAGGSILRCSIEFEVGTQVTVEPFVSSGGQI